MTKHVITAKYKEEGPEKLRFPDNETCPDGHTLVDDKGRPTSALAWDHKGEPKCADCEPYENHIFALVLKENGLKLGDKCPNGHLLTPNTTKYVLRTEKGQHHPDIVCKTCGKRVPPKITKATKNENDEYENPRFDLEHHERFKKERDPQVQGFSQRPKTYEEHAPEVHGFYMNRSRDDYRLRGRARGVDVAPNKTTPEGDLNFNLHQALDKGVQAGALKNGEEISFHHFLPIAAGGGHTPDNLVGTSKPYNVRINDAIPSTHEAKLFGMEHLIPALQVLNPRNIGYLDENNQPPAAPTTKNERNFHGYRRDADGKIVEVIEHKGQAGKGALTANDFTSVKNLPKRAYNQEDTQGGAARDMGPGPQGAPGEIRRVHYLDRAGQAFPVDTTRQSEGEFENLGVHRFDPLRPEDKKGKQKGSLFSAVESSNADEKAAGVRVSVHEFKNGQRHARLQEHIDDLVNNIGLERATPSGGTERYIPGFNQSSAQGEGSAFFQHTGKGMFTNPAIKAQAIRHTQVAGARMALPEPIKDTHAQLLGHPSQINVAPEHEAQYLADLQTHTGNINWGAQPKTLMVSQRVGAQGEVKPLAAPIVNPAVTKHLRDYTRDKGMLYSSNLVRMKLSEHRPVTLRKSHDHHNVGLLAQEQSRLSGNVLYTPTQPSSVYGATKGVTDQEVTLRKATDSDRIQLGNDQTSQSEILRAASLRREVPQMSGTYCGIRRKSKSNQL